MKTKTVVRILAAVSLFPVFYFIPACSDEQQNSAVVKKDTIKRRDPNNYLSDCRDLYNKALELDSIIQQQVEAEATLGNKAIAAFTDYAYYCDNDSTSAIYLIKAAQVARAISNIPQAEKSLQYCIEKYRTSPHRPAALFLLGQLYEAPTYLNNRDEAERIYEQVINEYPKSDWALSAKGALAMMGKSDEEIIKMLKEKK